LPFRHLRKPALNGQRGVKCVYYPFHYPLWARKVMARRIPQYTLHKATGQARVRINGQSHYLGAYNSPQSRERYDALISRYLNGAMDADRETITIGRLAVLFVDHAAQYYRKDGIQTSEISAIQSALRPLVKKYSREKVAHFGPRKLTDVRDAMIALQWTRTGINAAVRRIVRMLRWATENELIVPTVYHACKAVTGLRRGRSTAREADAVKPVPQTELDATMPFLNRQVSAMVSLQLATGMRPGEVCIMRLADIDRSGDVWTYRPHTHKTQHHGRDRVVFLGPKAQHLLTPFLATDRDRYLFSPTEAEAERNAVRREERRSPMTPSQAARTPKADPAWSPGDCYLRTSYARAIRRACREAGVPTWSPNQLRHNAATAIRKQFGLEAARTVLGHTEADTTLFYAEIDLDTARRVIAAVG
jgi:integrase